MTYAAYIYLLILHKNTQSFLCKHFLEVNRSPKKNGDPLFEINSCGVTLTCDTIHLIRLISLRHILYHGYAIENWLFVVQVHPITTIIFRYPMHIYIYIFMLTYLQCGLSTIDNSSRRGYQSSVNLDTHNSISFSAFFKMYLWKNKTNTTF